MSEAQKMLDPVLRSSAKERRALYWAGARPALGRLLGTLDREPDSLSFGSFDREHWAWKFRDWPLTMLQVGFYPLALAWRTPLPDNPFHQNAELLGWLLGALENTCRRQRPNGAFDSVGPNTQDHGVTLAMVRYLADTVVVLGTSVPAPTAQAVRDAVRRGCDFALESREDYAFISNHHALFALAFLSAHELLGDSSYLQHATRVVEAIRERQSADGWYAEYGGPDPGYETLGISYLASYWQRTRDKGLLDSLRRSVEFYSYCVHPDGSVGGNYGSRHTQLYFPLGFEILAGEVPLAASIAGFLAERWERGNVVTPATVDAENLAILAGNCMEAARLNDDKEHPELPSLPCETLHSQKSFEKCGITFAGRNHYYAIWDAAKGGVCSVFDKRNSALAYADAGYLVEAGGKRWSSQRMTQSWREDSAPQPGSCAVNFTEVRQQLPTPFKYLLLRLANLTLFRSRRLGEWLRRAIIERLITTAEAGPLRLQRRVAFEAEEIAFSDRITLQKPMTVRRLELVRSFTGIHMGSAKYFHAAELEHTPLPPVEGMAQKLESRKEVQIKYRLRMPARQPLELLLAAADESAEGRQPGKALTRT